VTQVCRRICANDADAADATQEALIAVVRGLGRFDGRSAFTTWLYRVTTNACLDELRRRRRRPVPHEPGDAGGRPGAGSWNGQQGDGADAVAARVDVDAALATVRPEYRAAVVLRDLCGLDYAEIAEVLDVPPGTVRSRIARGRAQLADLLRGNPAPSPRRPTTRP
jgi:RNA polymerase sigma-70 factor, ECF subfamily